MSGDLPRGPGGDRSRGDRFPDDAALVEALRRLGEQHEPDTEAIWARVDPSRAGDLGVVRLDERRDRHPRLDAARPRRPWVVAGLAAASVLGVLAAAQVFVLDRRDDGTTVAQSPTVSASRSTAAPLPSTSKPSPTPSSTALGSATSTRPAGSTRTGTATTSPGTASVRPTTGAAPPPPSVAPSPSTPVDTGRVVSIAPLVENLTTFGTSSEGYLDWVVPNRGDSRSVRAKRPVDGPGLDVVVPPGAVPTSSRLLTSWVDGFTEQTGSTGVWFVGQPGESWTVTVNPAAYDRWLVIQVGNSVGVSVWAQGQGWSGSEQVRFFGSKKVVVRIPASSATSAVTLTGDADDGLGVASAALQRA